MSKSLSQIVLPVAGGTALAVSIALVIANLGYEQNRMSSLERQVERATLQAEQASLKAGEEAAVVADLRAKVEALKAAEEARGTGNTDLTSGAPAMEGRLGLGREAMSQEIAAWDIDVLPDGRGLPKGNGDVFTGEEVFAEKCASCHGDFAEGVDNWPVLAGGFDTLADKDPVKTVGSYWPYLSTVWDYVHRSMPFGEAQTLTPDETYAIVAYILYSNDLVDDEFELSHENFSDFQMYNADGFVIDDRPEREYAQWSGEPCMENCKATVEITMRATFLDVTPDNGEGSVMNDASVADAPTFAAKVEPASATVDAPSSDTGTTAIDPAVIAAGEKVFKKCKACHAVGAGAKNKSGPQLNGLMGRVMGGVDGFKYSKGFKAASEEGRVWDEVELTAFLAKPKAYMKGTKMSFAGIRKDKDLTAVIEFLKTAGE